MTIGDLTRELITLSRVRPELLDRPVTEWDGFAELVRDERMRAASEPLAVRLQSLITNLAR